MGLILLVEDEPGAAALLRRYIENSSDGHRLAVFGKAAEARSEERRVGKECRL